MTFARQIAGLFWLFFLFALVSCAPQPTDCSQEDVFCVGLVTAYDGVEDHGLNQATWETLQSIEAPAKVARLDTIESIDVRDWDKNITFFTDHSYDLIVTVGTNLAETTAAVAAKNPSVSFIGIDQQLEDMPENMATITFAEDKAGFLAGMLAAMVSSSDMVGAVCETSGIEAVWQYCEGFRAGALYEKEDIEVFVVYRENGERSKTFNDPEWGRENMSRLSDRGVDTITGYGGNTTQGAFLAAAEKGIFVIGTEEDLYYRLPDVQEVLVTSIINDPGTLFSSLVLMASEGQAISGEHTGQIRLAPFRTPELTTAEMQSNMEDTLQKIENGEIKIDIPKQK